MINPTPINHSIYLCESIDEDKVLLYDEATGSYFTVSTEEILKEAGRIENYFNF